MFRKLVVAFATLGVITIAAGCAKTPAPQDVAADKTKLQTDAVAWFDRFAAADSEGLDSLYAEDALVMPPNAPALTGRPAIKTYLGTMISQTKAAGLSVKPGQITGSDVSGDLGWISGTYSVQDSTGASVDSGSYLSIHQRANGSWHYIRDIWNSDHPVAAAAPAKKMSAKKPAKK